MYNPEAEKRGAADHCCGHKALLKQLSIDSCRVFQRAARLPNRAPGRVRCLPTHRTAASPHAAPIHRGEHRESAKDNANVSFSVCDPRLKRRLSGPPSLRCALCPHPVSQVPWGSLHHVKTARGDITDILLPISLPPFVLPPSVSQDGHVSGLIQADMIRLIHTRPLYQ